MFCSKISEEDAKVSDLDCVHNGRSNAPVLEATEGDKLLEIRVSFVMFPLILYGWLVHDAMCLSYVIKLYLFNGILRATGLPVLPIASAY